NASDCALKSSFVSDAPSKLVSIALPMRTVATLPAAPASLRYGMPFLASADLMMSQDCLNVALPTGSNWNAQRSGSAVTVTGAAATAASSAGLTLWVSALNVGKYVITASRQPPSTMTLRPIL